MNVFVVHGVTFIAYGLVAVDWLAVVQLMVNSVKLVILALSVVAEVGVGDGLGEVVAGHFGFLSCLVDNYDITPTCVYDTPRIRKRGAISHPSFNVVTEDATTRLTSCCNLPYADTWRMC